jgi:hypothetical protein
MYDSISEGSEDDKGGVAYEVEDDLTSVKGASDVVLEDEYRSLPSSDDEEGECREVGFQESLRVLVDGSLRMECNDVKLRPLRAVHVEVPPFQTSWTLVWLTRQFVTLV